MGCCKWKEPEHWGGGAENTSRLPARSQVERRLAFCWVSLSILTQQDRNEGVSGKRRRHQGDERRTDHQVASTTRQEG